MAEGEDRQFLGLSLPVELYRRLDEAAAKNGQFLSCAVEDRLEASLRSPGVTLEQVRAIIGETVRAALREEREIQRTNLNGSHSMQSDYGTGLFGSSPHTC